MVLGSKGKKLGSVVMAAAMAALSFTGCSSLSKKNNAFSGDKLSIVCTISSVYEFTEQLAGDNAEIKLLLPPGVEPHGWEPSTDDMALISSADMLVYSGAGLETWLDSCLDAVENDDLITVDASSDVDLLTFGQSTATLDGVSMTDANDPHIWMSPANAILEVQTIADALCEADPDNSEEYKSAVDEYVEQLTALDDEYREALAPYAGETVVVSHEAFGYMCAEYGMKQLAIDGLSSDSEPDAATMSEIVDYINDNGVGAIYYEEIINPDAANVIGDETGCTLIPLNTLESFDDGDTYITVMEENLSSLCEGLETYD